MNKDYVSTGKPKVGGAVFRAPIGTTLPANATATLNSAFKSQGYCSDAGLKNNGSRTTQDIKAWGGDIVASAQTEKSDIFTVTLIETLNADVLKTVHGDSNVTGSLSEGLIVQADSDELPESCWGFDMIMRGGVLKRVVLPSAKVTNVAEITYDDSDAVGYQLTISAYPDASGNTHYEYLKTSSSSALPDTTLSQLTIGSLTLDPVFLPTITTYRAATTNATDTITAAASSGDATVVIKNGSTTVTSGSAATWTSGTNTVTVTVTNGTVSKVYTVTVTKS